MSNKSLDLDLDLDLGLGLGLEPDLMPRLVLDLGQGIGLERSLDRVSCLAMTSINPKVQPSLAQTPRRAHLRGIIDSHESSPPTTPALPL